LNALLELAIRVVSDIGRGAGACIHEVLERGVTALLELNIIVEGIADKCVNITFKIEQLLSKLTRVV
jgi:hypothetical protein